MLFLTREPLWLSGLILVGLASLIAFLGQRVVHRYVAFERLPTNNEVAGLKFAMVGRLYALLLAFSIFLVWQKYSDAEKTVEKEAGAAAAMYHLSSGLGEAQASPLRNALTVYLQSAISDEWPAMDSGKQSGKTHLALGAVYKAILGPAASQRNVALIFELFEQVDTLTQARRSRILAAEGTVPNILWAVLFVGGAATIGFTFFFGTMYLRSQILMTALLALLICSELLIVVALNQPFSGTVKVGPGALADVVADHA